MLTTVEFVQSIPGLSNLAAAPIAYLNQLIGAADRAIKTFCKQNLELTAYNEFYSGTGQRDVVCKQFPILSAQTTVAAGSNGDALPQATINVASTTGFHPGIAADPNGTAPTITVQTSANTWTSVTYTGTTSTTFTGCSGGSGTLVTGYTVGTPTVWYNPSAYFGQASGAFDDGDLVVQGSQWVALLDSGGVTSNRGLLRRIGGVGQGFVGYYPENFYSGKLAAYRMPTWPKGDGNIKVAYAAGYAPGQVPYDLQYACAMLCSYMVRVLPNGQPLSSESLGAYSYSILQGSASSGIPELGSLPQTLAQYREVSW